MKLLIVVFVLIGGASAFFYWNQNEGTLEKKKNVPREYTVKKEDLTISIVSSGTIQAKNKTRIKSTLPGNQKIVYLIDEGTLVKQGQEVVRLDDETILKEINTAENQLIELLANVEDAKTKVEITESENADRLEEGELVLEKAIMDLEKFKKGDQPLEERRLLLEKQRANTKYINQKEKISQLKSVYKEGFITKVEYEEELLNLETMKVDHESSVLRFDMYLKYDKPQGLKEKQLEVKGQKNEILRIKKQNKTNLSNHKTQLRQTELKYAKAKQALKKLKNQLNLTRILAPADGIVLHGRSRSYYSSREEIKVGSTVTPHTTIITLPEVSQMEIVTLVHESEIELVKKGLKATVTIKSKDDQVFTAKVTKVAAVANTGSWKKGDDVKEFQVTLLIDKLNPGLRSGITAKVEIHIDHIPKTMLVPRYSVYSDEKDTYVYVNEQGDIKKRKVEIGKSSFAFSEVKSGLSVGETILLQKP